jgi:hypothetical protein
MIVYTGECDNLQCIQGNDNEFLGCGLEAGITFNPHDYSADWFYILIYGSQKEATGRFGVQAIVLDGPTNEKCEDTTELARATGVHCQCLKTIFPSL